MKILITPNELIDRGLWIAACERIGIREQEPIDLDEEITLTHDQAITLGLIPKPTKWERNSNG